jgi:hypothetical protein
VYGFYYLLDPILIGIVFYESDVFEDDDFYLLKYSYVIEDESKHFYSSESSDKFSFQLFISFEVNIYMAESENARLSV